MMSPENIPPASDPNRKPTTTLKPPQEPPLKCPRCDSANTKFCYYNNYSLTQPRHFCKTCRRYWTKGGALRNVPIGGGCRKTKKLRSSSSCSVAASISSTSSKLMSTGTGGEFGPGFKFLGPNSSPGMEFQLGGLSLPRLHPATAGVYTQFITSSGACTPSPGTGNCFGLDLLGLNYSIPSSSSSSSSSLIQASTGGGGDNNNNQISISSIESLSSINQEMHWKLQQQRLALIYGPSPVDDHDNGTNNNQEKPQGAINLFKNLDINCGTRKIEVGPTEWLFDQIQTSSSPANYGATTTNNTSCNNVNEVWGDLNHHQQQQHHHHHHHHLQFNGLQ